MTNLAGIRPLERVVYPDGMPVKGPKALCELQGYVFDAKVRLAEAADSFGDPRLAARLRKEAAELRERFEEHFWCEDIGTYAYALDGDKNPVKTIASNAGHLLWSGIDSPFVPWLIVIIPTVGGLLSGVLVFSVAPEAEGHGTDAAIASPTPPGRRSATPARRSGHPPVTAPAPGRNPQNPNS
jgi:hypothetical protein